MSLRLRSMVSLLIVAAALPAITPIRQSTRAAPPASVRDSKAVNRGTPKEKPFAPDKLVRAFRGSREDLRHKALDDAEQHHFADAALSAALWQVIELELKVNPAPDSLLQAVRLFVRLDDPEAYSHRVALLSAADPRIVLTVIDVLGERRQPGVFDALTRLREHSAYKTNYALRHAVVSAVARYNEPASIEFLIATLAAFDGQLKYEAARQLTRLTGENFGGKTADWRKWWDEHRQGFRIVPDGAAAQTAAKRAADPVPWDYDVPQFFGTPIFARRVVFVIDKSRSMLSSVDGVTRLDDAEKELEAALRKLPDDVWFEIIAYNDSEQPYRGRLVQATAAEKSTATQFIYSLVAENKTDIYDTLADALQVDPNLEAMLFLSDGEPNVGTIVDGPTILQKITWQNAARRVSINTIGIDARGAAEDFLRKLANDNFGEFRSIR